jgi:hypothetical protein
MVKGIIAVVVGYAVMFVLIFATFTAAYLAMGADRAFQPGSYEVSCLWLTVSFALGLIASVVGGYVCAAVAGGRQAPLVLALLVVVLGLVMAVPVALAGDVEGKARIGDVANIEAMNNARQPVWVVFLNPLLGAAGVLLGARLKGGQPG